MGNFFLITFFLIGLQLHAQQIILNGQVSIHNSRYNTGNIQFVENAYISAPFTKPDDTDREGRFGLEFVGIDAGTAVRIKVEQAELEVVNEYDLQRVIIGRKPLLRVYMAPKGQLAQAQTELYNISKKALFAEKDALITRLLGNEQESKAAIVQLERKLGVEIANPTEAIELLESRIESLEERLPQFAQELAVVNLDFASELYRKAYENYKKGEIEQAIGVLDDVKLDQSYRSAVGTLEEGKKLENIGKNLQEQGLLQINHIVDSYELKAESCLLLFQYRIAIKAYEKIIQIYETGLVDTNQLGKWYGEMALALFYVGQFEKAIDIGHKTIDLLEDLVPPNYQALVSSYSNMAVCYRRFGNHVKSLEYHQKALHLIESISDVDKPTLASVYNNLANYYISSGSLEKALIYQRKALNTLKSVEPVDSLLLSVTYSNIGVTYNGMKQIEKAHEVLDTALALWDTLVNPLHPNLAAIYNNKGAAYYYAGKYQKAIAGYQKVLLVQEKLLHPKHPDLLNSYYNTALACFKSGNYLKAKEYYNKALKIVGSLDMRGESLATLYNHIGLNYSSLSNSDSAMLFYRRAISALEVSGDTFSVVMANSLFNLGVAYKVQGNPEESLELLEKALKIYKKIYGPRSLKLMEVLLVSGNIHLSMKEYAKAIESYQTACNIDVAQTRPIAINNLGAVYLLDGQFDKAKEAFIMLEKRLPNDSRVFYNWAKYYSMVSDIDQALSNLEKAMQMGFNNLPAIQTLESLKEEPRYQAIIEKLKKEK